jgi:hypothetical protein
MPKAARNVLFLRLLWAVSLGVSRLERWYTQRNTEKAVKLLNWG